VLPHEEPRIVRLDTRDPDPDPDGLARGGVEVWLFEPSAERAARLAASLAPDELERGERLSGQARVRYTDVRGCLRAILGGHLGVTPRAVPIAYEHHGRPRLADGHASSLAFSVSHSESLAAIAVSAGGPVGVDVEARRPRARVERLLEAILAPGERERFAGLTGAALETAFLDLWCVKESCSKLVGRGLTLPLRTIAVDDPIAPVSAATVGDDGPRCAVRRLPATPGYAGALAHGP
jgi:4'-phosphopantetheinyl transferase